MNVRMVISLLPLLVGSIFTFISVFLITVKMPDLAIVTVMLSIGILMVTIGATQVSTLKTAILNPTNLLNFLTKDELEILQVIVNEGGEAMQYTLPDKTGFSPAKISRLLINLESRGIITRGKKEKGRVVKVNKQVVEILKTTQYVSHHHLNRTIKLPT